MNNIIDIQKIKNDIEQAEQKQNATKSKQQIIDELKPHIQVLKDKGYTISEIVRFLGERNLDISEGTLKSYLNRNNTNKVKTKSKNIRTSKKPKMIQQDIIQEAEKENINQINDNINNNNRFPLNDGEV